MKRKVKVERHHHRFHSYRNLDLISSPPPFFFFSFLLLPVCNCIPLHLRLLRHDLNLQQQQQQSSSTPLIIINNNINIHDNVVDVIQKRHIILVRSLNISDSSSFFAQTKLSRAKREKLQTDQKRFSLYSQHHRQVLTSVQRRIQEETTTTTTTNIR